MLRELLLDVVFPPTCVMCEAPDAWMCQECLFRIELARHARCPRCGMRSVRGHVCHGDWPFASILSLGFYADPVLRGFVTSYKYRSLVCLEDSWTELLKRFRSSFLEPWPWAGRSSLTVVALPSDEHRVRTRAFDHAVALTQVVRDTLVPWATITQGLRRLSMASVANATLPADAARWQNVKNAFHIVQPIATPVLLVDDVMTTGASLVTAARALKQAGATEVHVFTLANAK